ncbi:hypothetical protein BN126360181 [Stenotrophomonas indicatrix]|nr:hypothetical protein BN126360181 [Stenotrophomonas indicatrix]
MIHSAQRRAEALACECPPAPACGHRLPLYFARKGLRPACGNLRWPQESSDLRAWCRKPSLVGAGGGLGKVKEEVAANGRRRGTFAQAPTCPDGALQIAESRTKTRSRIQTPGKKRPGRGRDLPGPDCMGGGTHAMSVGVAPVAVACQSHPPCICIDAMQHTPIMRQCNKNHEGAISGALRPFRSMG